MAAPSEMEDDGVGPASMDTWKSAATSVYPVFRAASGQFEQNQTVARLRGCPDAFADRFRCAPPAPADGTTKLTP